MKKGLFISIIIIGTILIFGTLTGSLYSYYSNNYSRPGKAVVTDLIGDEIIVETSNKEICDEIHILFVSQNQSYIGGKVEKYSNDWGFHFKGSTILFPKIVDQECLIYSSIKDISENLDTCLGTYCYFICSISELVR